VAGQTVEEAADARREARQLLDVYLGQALEHARAARSEAEADDTAVVGIVRAPHQPCLLRTVDELHRAVMAQQQRVRDVADRGSPIAMVAADGEEQLVLRRRDAGGDSLRLAPVQELAQRGPELEQTLVVAVS
jgi:hypothetical protein